jgi:DNA-3-methyladenine glycosylase
VTQALREVLAGEPTDAAVHLLGCRVSRGGVTVRLTEVEAYAGPGDPASHAGRGRTPRSAVMFGPPGHAYVYLSYGMHLCLNVTCAPDGTAAAVLLRAGEVVEGLVLARQRRPGVADRDLARGPGRLCRALGVVRSDDGSDLLDSTAQLRLAPAAGPPAAPESVRSGPRVGVRLAADRPWRFWLAGEPSVSAYRPHVPRRAGSAGAD